MVKGTKLIIVYNTSMPKTRKKSVKTSKHHQITRTKPKSALQLLLPPHRPKLWERLRLFKRLRSKRLVVPLVLAGVFLIGIYWFILKDIPSPNTLSSLNSPLTTKIFDRNGKLLFNIFVDENRTLVKLHEIPEYIREATIAIEDKDFYKHRGISPVGGMVRALKELVFRQQLQGGSTITQQLVKTALLTPERTPQRKVKEIILALLVELRYTKDQILEMYLNQVPYGGTAWGIEAAAQRYFGKSSKEVNLAEAALLAGLPQAPTRYSPFGANPEFAQERMRTVLKRMVEDHYISQEEADAAAAWEFTFQQPTTPIQAPHFVMYVKKQLVEKYGEKLVEQGGLKVTTTLDLELQDFAQTTVASEVAKLKNYNVGNGAALVTRPYTGEILAMVGSTDYFASESGNFNVTIAERQPGSSIKPINYAIGLENKTVTPATVLIDEPSCFGTFAEPYCPKNYDGSFHGPVQLRFALGNSYNIPAVKMLKLNGVETMTASTSAFGITTLNDPNRFGLSLTLGGGEVPMTEMATAFGIFANGGLRKNLVSILKIQDANGNVLDEYQDPNLNTEIISQLLIDGPRVISRETAFLISHILLDQNARSAAFGSSFLQVSGHPAVSVKTGTTDELRDNWTIGFTPEVVAATWVGNNDNTKMNPYLTSGVTGAAPIWNKIMSYYLRDKKETWPKQPDGIVGLEVCSISGLLPQTENACPARFEYFIKGTEPKATEQLKESVPIDTSTDKLARPNETEHIEVKEKLVVRDAFGVYCIDCNHENDPVHTIR